jgi:hypothetical protein
MSIIRPDDLTDLFEPDPAGSSQPVHFRQGVVVSWDKITAANVVRVGTSELTNLPVLNTSESRLLEKGAVVSIAVIGQPGGARTFGIWGRMTIPGTPEAVSALSAIGTISSYVHATENTSSASFVDLTTRGPEVSAVVGPSGRVQVTLSALINMLGSASDGVMAVEMSGANTVAASLFRYAYAYAGPAGSGIEAGKTFIIPNLTPGLTTFTAKYQTQAGVLMAFGHRELTVVTL